MAFRNGCCCRLLVLRLRLPVVQMLLFPCPELLRSTLCLPCDAVFVYCRGPMPRCPMPMPMPVACGLMPVASPPEMYLRATPFIKTLNTKYMACVIVIRAVSGPQSRRERPLDTMPSNVLLLLLLFVVDSSAYRSVNNKIFFCIVWVLHLVSLSPFNSRGASLP